MANVVVIGSGAMGLAAAYRAAKMGHAVTVLEADDEPGGMAGHFDFDGLSLERYYHFVCKTDYPTFELMDELGIGDKMRWRETTMGFFYDGKLYPWGNPIALLSFPKLSLWNKLRYALFAFVCVRKNKWPAIETETARSWITRWCGQQVYDQMWRPLFEFKFYEYAEEISALWIWTRIRRTGRSRRSLMQEELGYIEGGSITLVDALVDGLEQHGGMLRPGVPAQRVNVASGRVVSVRTPDGEVPADAVICTCPTPYVSKLIPDLPEATKKQYDAIRNIGVICVVFKLARSVTMHFWTNITEPDIEIPGVIEFSNLRDFGDDHVVYVPYYMPTTRDKWEWSDEDLVSEALGCLQHINADLTPEDVRATKVARLRYAQPICEAGFAARLPPVQTPIAGLQVADTCFYYPEDRGIAESVRLGSQMAEAVGRP